MTGSISKKSILVFSLLVLTAIFFVSPVVAQTYDFASSSGLVTSANKAGYAIGSDATTVEGLIGTIIYVILGLVGVIFLGFALYGAITWMTAGGNEEKVKKANKILTGALFGLLITLAAYIISYFLINYFWE
jgi:hypothetical protein